MSYVYQKQSLQLKREKPAKNIHKLLLVLANKSAAMFGLDARIALAIFGALSVITGAALYSAIKDASSTAVLTELRSLGKAWESFYIDTGTPFVSGNPAATDWEKYQFKYDELTTDSGLAGWNGPYVSTFRHSWVGLYSIADTTWGDTTLWDPAHTCNGGDANCYIWSGIAAVSEESVKAIDAMVDNSDDLDSGNFRALSVGDAFDYRTYLKIAPHR